MVITNIGSVYMYMYVHGDVSVEQIGKEEPCLAEIDHNLLVNSCLNLVSISE